MEKVKIEKKSKGLNTERFNNQMLEEVKKEFESKLQEKIKARIKALEVVKALESEIVELNTQYEGKVEWLKKSELSLT